MTNAKQLISIDTSWPTHVFRDTDKGQFEIVAVDKDRVGFIIADEKNAAHIVFNASQANKILLCLQGMINIDLTALD